MSARCLDAIRIPGRDSRAGPRAVDHALQLPMAASIILATARDQQARLHTMDSDFRGIAGVEWLGSE